MRLSTSSETQQLAKSSSIKSNIDLIDTLVNNVGYLPNLISMRDSDVEDWFSGFEINVKGTAIVTNAFLDVAAPDPVLTNHITSGVDFIPIPGYASNAVSKLAALKFFDYVQAENPDVHIMDKSPGVIETAMSKNAANAGILSQENLSCLDVEPP